MPNTSEDIWALIFWAGIGALFVARSRLRRTKRVFITDYQCGVRFVKGSFVDVLGPGIHQIYSDRQQITIIDTRPLPIVVERIFYQDILQAPSVIV
jgi:hypothetical protein